MNLPEPDMSKIHELLEREAHQREYNIWAEGYAATGESGGATCLGHARGESFQEACEQFFAGRDDAHFFNPKKLTYWACHLFPDEASARRSFG